MSSASELEAARQETRENAAAALQMIREAVETLGPPGILPPPGHYGPEPIHETAAIVDALYKMLRADAQAISRRRCDKALRCARDSGREAGALPWLHSVLSSFA